MNVANKDHAQPDFYVLGIIDGKGATHRAIAEELGDSIYIEANRASEQYAQFEADAYHLRQWAAEQHFTYFCYGYQWSALGTPLTKEMVQA